MKARVITGLILGILIPGFIFLGFCLSFSCILYMSFMASFGAILSAIIFIILNKSNLLKYYSLAVLVQVILIVSTTVLFDLFKQEDWNWLAVVSIIGIGVFYTVTGDGLIEKDKKHG